MIAYIALFSALLSRLTALAWGSTWVTSFIARFLNIHRSGALAWLVSHETATVSAQILCTPYNHVPCHFMQSHIRNGVCVFRCNLPSALLAEWPGSFTCYCGNTEVELIPKWVSTESRPWRRKFSRRSSRDSNLGPFNYESGALTTELSPPRVWWTQLDARFSQSPINSVVAKCDSTNQLPLKHQCGLTKLWCYHLFFTLLSDQ